MPGMLDKALQLRSGLKAWFDSDRYLRSLGDGDATRNPRLKKAFGDNWDDRIGEEKFGGVWSIDKAKGNARRPACGALSSRGRRRCGRAMKPEGSPALQ